MKKLLIGIAWLLSLLGAYHYGQRCTREVTLTSTVTDTVRITQPEIVVIHSKGTMVEKLPLADSTAGDSALVEIPIEQAVYADTAYRAYVSGYKPRLDSLVFVRNINTFAKPKPQKRWSIGIQAGYGITPAGFQPYIGIGLGFKIL